MSFAWFKRKSRGSDSIEPKAPSRPALEAAELDAQIRQIEADLAVGAVDTALARVQDLLETNPTDTRVLINHGACLYSMQEYAEAISPLVAALQAEPENIRAHYILSASIGAQGDHSTAVEISVKALALHPRDVDMLLLAANSWVQLGEYLEAARLINLAIDIKPDFVMAHHRLESISKHSTYKRNTYEFSPRVAQARRRVINRLLAAHRRKGLEIENLTALLAMLEASRDTFPMALKVAQSSADREPMHPVLADALGNVFLTACDAAALLRMREICFDAEPQNLYFKLALSMAWLVNGTEHWTEAWRIMTQTLHQSRPKMHPDQVPLWEGEKLGKRKVLVYQDQGMGDAILAFRFLPILAARGLRFDLWVFPSIQDLAAGTTGYENLIRTPALPDPRELGCDFAVPMFGLVSALSLGIDDLANPPVVRPPKGRVVSIREKIAALPGMRIGLMCGGNPRRRDDWERSVPLEDLSALAKVPGISWINLMVDQRIDRGDLKATFRMFDPTPDIKDFADTAAIVEELDAVIAVDSSVAHVAGNLGKPFWVLVPSSIDWRWQIGSHINPWWPTGRMLRSEAPGVWSCAIQTCARELAEFVASRKMPGVHKVPDVDNSREANVV